MNQEIVVERGHGGGDQSGGGPKYFVSIEGQEYPWPKDTITFEEIANLGGWQPSEGVIEIDKDNNERTLHPGEVVQLKPGHGFSKKVRWKRGG
jgi:Multiubiquitin